MVQRTPKTKLPNLRMPPSAAEAARNESALSRQRQNAKTRASNAKIEKAEGPKITPKSTTLNRPETPPQKTEFTRPPSRLSPGSGRPALEQELNALRRMTSPGSSITSSPSIRALPKADQELLKNIVEEAKRGSSSLEPRPASDIRLGDKRPFWARGQGPAIRPPPSGVTPNVSPTDANGFRARNAGNVTKALAQEMASRKEAAAVKQATDVLVKNTVRKQGVAAARSLAPLLIRMSGRTAIAALVGAGALTATAGYAFLSAMWPGATAEDDTMEGRGDMNAPPVPISNPTENDGINPVTGMPFEGTNPDVGEGLPFENGEANDSEGINPVTGMPFEGTNPDVGEGMEDDMPWPPETDGLLPEEAIPNRLPMAMPQSVRSARAPVGSTRLPPATPPSLLAPPVAAQDEQDQSQGPAPAAAATPRPTTSLLGQDSQNDTPDTPTAAGPLGTNQAKVQLGSLDHLPFGQAFNAARKIVGKDGVFPWFNPKTGTTQMFTTRRLDGK